MVSNYPVKNPLRQKGADLSKYIFSLIHDSKQAKKPPTHSNRHRPKIASNTSQSRISKNFNYFKQDSIDPIS